MSDTYKLLWDQDTEKKYYTGADKGVLYPAGTDGKYKKGVAWNGLTKVGEKPSGAEATALYANNKKYLDLIASEQFGATIEAYMYPDEFNACNGRKEIAPGVFATQQSRSPFGLSYRTLIGNDTEGTDYGYEIHLVYNAKAGVSEKENSTVNESPEAATLSWEISTTPIDVAGMKPTSHIVIDSTKTAPEKMEALLKILWGFGDEDPRLPTPAELAELFEATPDPDPVP